MKRFWIFAATITGAIASSAAPAAGNAESGAAKAAVCQACHGANGNSVNPEWPSLAGLGADYIAEQLQNFKDGKRNSPIMMPIAAPLSAQDMADLGAYFDSLVNTGLEADPSYWQAGEKIYRGGDKVRGIPACMACHGPTGRGNEPAKFPALRGEESVYIAKQLRDYASGARAPGPGGIMPVIAKRLSPDDIRNLASYVQGLR
jgi:cytochrome c553